MEHCAPILRVCNSKPNGVRSGLLHMHRPRLKTLLIFPPGHDPFCNILKDINDTFPSFRRRQKQLRSTLRFRELGEGAYVIRRARRVSLVLLLRNRGQRV